MSTPFSVRASIGRSVCVWGAVIFLWNIAEWHSEESFVGTLSECVVYRSHESGIAVYSEGVLMVRCVAIYSKNGAFQTTELNSQLPSDFRLGISPQRAGITVAALNSKRARFTAFPRDWGDTLVKVLFFEFIGALLLLNNRKGN